LPHIARCTCPPSPTARLAPIVPLLLLTAGCWTTKEQGEALRRDVDQLKRQLKDDIVESRKERKKLQKVMEQATALLTRNSADVGAQVDRIQAKVDRVGGQMDEQVNGLKQLKEEFDKFKTKVDVKLEGLEGTTKGTPMPTDKEQLFKAGQAQLNAGKHTEGRRLLRHFLKTFPKDGKAHQAQLLLGESYYLQQKFPAAIVELKKVLDQYKRSASVPEAIFKIGMAFYQLTWCVEAKQFLKLYVKKYRRGKNAPRARKVLRLIRKNRRNKKVCR
jgi:TolA-binding protein